MPRRHHRPASSVPKAIRKTRKAERESARTGRYPNGRVCRLGSGICCEKPAPVSHDQAAHDRGVCVADTDYERQWWLECWSCGNICTCEV
jgi:hypothetical protein